jgi:Quercetinase C-terminal cupin domain
MGATVKAGERVTLSLDPKRHAYLVPATGAVDVGVRIEARDGAAITDLTTVEIVGIEERKSFWSTPPDRRGSTEKRGGPAFSSFELQPALPRRTAIAMWPAIEATGPYWVDMSMPTISMFEFDSDRDRSVVISSEVGRKAGNGDTPMM